MLSPKTQTNLKNAKSYFAKHLSVGNYYGENARVQGEWQGEAASKLGLVGAVASDDFFALCENKNPNTRQRLTQRHEAVRRVFFDFTFSPPKSVSIAALVGDDERIVGAHREAVKAAVNELEQFGATRIRRAGTNADRVTGNMVAALFQHETSRALDPHLHTHCVVFNATHDAEENRWKALQNYQMLAAQKYVENVYYHELAGALRRYGYTVENSARGDFEIANVRRELCGRFSKRHREIDAQLQRLLAENPEKAGGNINDIRERLAHKERSRKRHDMPRDRLRNSGKSSSGTKTGRH